MVNKENAEQPTAGTTPEAILAGTQKGKEDLVQVYKSKQEEIALLQAGLGTLRESINSVFPGLIEGDAEEETPRAARGTPKAAKATKGKKGKGDDGEKGEKENHASRAWEVLKAAGKNGCNLPELTEGVMKNGYTPEDPDGFAQSLYVSGKEKLKKLGMIEDMEKVKGELKRFRLTADQLKKSAYVFPTRKGS